MVSALTRDFTLYTSEQNAVAYTSSGQSTRVATHASYHSTTATQTKTVAADSTTSASTTYTVTTSALSPFFTSTTTRTESNVVSTTGASTITYTTYGTAASASITAPVLLVPVSEVAATEQAWEVVVTTDSAGYPSHVATTFTRRTGTLATTQNFWGITGPAGFTTTITQATGSTRAVTLTTTSLQIAADTYVPEAGSFPATATATRNFTLLSTSSFTTSVLDSRTLTSLFTGAHSTNYVAFTSTFLSYQSTTVSVTANASPTQTGGVAAHVTWSASTSLVLRTLTPIATSETSSASEFGSLTGVDIYGLTETGPTSSSASTTDSTTNTPPGATVTYGSHTETTTTTESDQTVSSSSELFTEGITYSAYSYSTNATYLTSTGTTVANTTGSVTLDGGGVGTDYSTTSSYGATTLSTSYTSSGSSYTTSALGGYASSSASATGTFSNTVSGDATGTASSTFGATTSTTLNTTITYPGSTYTTTSTFEGSYWSTGSSSYSYANGYSSTYPLLHPEVLSSVGHRWTAHAMHPRHGWRDPLALERTDAVYSALSLSPVGLPWSLLATQDARYGPLTPLLNTFGSYVSSGVSTYSVEFRTSDSRFHFTSGVTTTNTTTTGTASFAGATSASRYEARPTVSGAAYGSNIGGIPAKSQYFVALYSPPGVLHTTTQSAGTQSSSGTVWNTGAPMSLALDSAGQAFPTRNESAWSVTQRRTEWSYEFGGEGPDSTGSTSKPVFTLSLNPDI